MKIQYTPNQLYDAHKEGYDAYLDNLTLEDNPYNNNDEWELFCEWKEGYFDAAQDD